MRNSPNFFIVGGPKCGTTAMTEFLRTHEDIFISEPKEPNFFADMPKIEFVDNLKDYLNLFKKATKKKIIGDASIFYMFSKVALENIHEFNPDSKILVMIRNPLEMVPSFHLQILFTLEEDQEDFESALALEEKRKKWTLLILLIRKSNRLTKNPINLLLMFRNTTQHKTKQTNGKFQGGARVHPRFGV